MPGIQRVRRAVREKHPEALSTIREHHPKPDRFLTLRDAQLVVARQYGHPGWAELREAVARSSDMQCRQGRTSAQRETASDSRSASGGDGDRHPNLCYGLDFSPWNGIYRARISARSSILQLTHSSAESPLKLDNPLIECQFLRPSDR
jgi:hypothetical protein